MSARGALIGMFRVHEPGRDLTRGAGDGPPPPGPERRLPDGPRRPGPAPE